MPDSQTIERIMRYQRAVQGELRRAQAHLAAGRLDVCGDALDHAKSALAQLVTLMPSDDAEAGR